jgi:hypothetical protein
MIIYKIRNKKTKLYSKGGVDPKWDEEGKSWNYVNLVKHLKQFISEEYNLQTGKKTGRKQIVVPQGWEIVPLELKELQDKVKDVQDFMATIV